MITEFDLKDFSGDKISCKIRASKDDNRILVLHISQKLNDRCNLDLFNGFIDADIIINTADTIKKYLSELK